MRDSTDRFEVRLARVAKADSALCLGIDPSREVLAQWALPESISGLKEFCARLVAWTEGHVAIVKPQMAYFERFGAKGIEVLEEVVDDFRARGTIVILDAKRGDIGSTSAAYGEAYFGPASSLRVDALTVHPFLGFDSLLPMLEFAQSANGYVFVVVASSNVEGVYLQNARVDANRTIVSLLISQIAAYNSGSTGNSVCGAVIGATRTDVPTEQLRALGDAWILCPGIGAQGASYEALSAWPSKERLIPTISRAILMVGNDEDKIRAALLKHKEEARRLTMNPAGR